MDKLQEYINDYYDGAGDWFVQECGDSWHLDRINQCLDMAEYLDGKHSILKSENEVWKGKVIKTRKVILQFCKPIITFQNSFILNNPVTLTSDCPETLDIYKEVYKVGKYNNLDSKILDALLKYGEVFEYVFVDDDKKIKSHLIKSCDGYPIINSKSEYVGFIEHYITGGISYYAVFSENIVVEYSDKGGELFKVAEHNNLSGLPIRYLLPSDGDGLFPRSDLKDWIGIVDELETHISRYSDAFFKFLSPCECQVVFYTF